MKKYQVNEGKQLELMDVKEGTLKNLPAKRVDIVSLCAESWRWLQVVQAISR